MSSPTNNTVPQQPVGPQYTRITTYLAQSKTQSSNNALYQAINGLVNATQSFQSFVNNNFSTINSSFGNFTNAFNAINAALNALETAVSNIQLEINNNIIPAIIQLALEAVQVIEVDTSGGPVTVVLSSVVVAGFVIIKDITGNAGANNITMTGTVEGVVNPVINTNYGLFKVYLSNFDSSFHTW